tara:strand:- start:991 stop:1809 length:819 start_codon:yes stop_codon:yes gene_type:complete
MKHLVIGSSGQIGAHLVKYLKKQGEEVFEFDIVNESYQDLRQPHNPLLESYMERSDMVHFLAFDVGGAKYLEQYQDSFDFISNNMKIMTNTFELIQKYNLPFIFASSQMSEMSYSTYGVLKSLGERLTKSLGGLIVRFWNVYGYEQDEEKSHVITDFIKMAKYEGAINMRTDGTESRQFLYADDACECLYKLSLQYKSIPRTKDLHITSFKWSTVNGIAHKIKDISNCEVIKSNRKDATQKNAMNKPNTDILDYWKPTTQLKQGIMNLYNMY